MPVKTINISTIEIEEKTMVVCEDCGQMYTIESFIIAKKYPESFSKYHLKGKECMLIRQERPSYFCPFCGGHK